MLWHPCRDATVWTWCSGGVASLNRPAKGFEASGFRACGVLQPRWGHATPIEAPGQWRNLVHLVSRLYDRSNDKSMTQSLRLPDLRGVAAKLGASLYSGGSFGSVGA
jgi:hypothetical protein